MSDEQVELKKLREHNAIFIVVIKDENIRLNTCGYCEDDPFGKYSSTLLYKFTNDFVFPCNKIK